MLVTVLIFLALQKGHSSTGLKHRRASQVIGRGHSSLFPSESFRERRAKRVFINQSISQSINQCILGKTETNRSLHRKVFTIYSSNSAHCCCRRIRKPTISLRLAQLLYQLTNQELCLLTLAINAALLTLELQVGSLQKTSVFSITDCLWLPATSSRNYSCKRRYRNEYRKEDI